MSCIVEEFCWKFEEIEFLNVSYWSSKLRLFDPFNSFFL